MNSEHSIYEVGIYIAFQVLPLAGKLVFGARTPTA